MISEEREDPRTGLSYYVESGPVGALRHNRTNRSSKYRYVIRRGSRLVMISKWRWSRSRVEALAEQALGVFANAALQPRIANVSTASQNRGQYAPSEQKER